MDAQVGCIKSYTMCLLVAIAMDGAIVPRIIQDGRRRYQLCRQRLAQFHRWVFDRRSKAQASTSTGTCVPPRPAEIRVIYYPVLLDHPPPYESHTGNQTELSISELDSDTSSENSSYDDTEERTQIEFPRLLDIINDDDRRTI